MSSICLLLEAEILRKGLFVSLCPSDVVTSRSLAWLVLWIMFDLATDSSSWCFVSCALFALSVVRLLIGGVDPLFLDPSDGVFGRFDLAALCGCRTLIFCLLVCLSIFACASPSVFCQSEMLRLDFEVNLSYVSCFRI